MRYITFGTRATPASQVVLGLMRIRDKTPTQVARLIDAAVSVGINMVDTAPVYGPSETLLGDVFASTPRLRDRLLVQTKLGIRDDPVTGNPYYDFSREYIIESVERSLSALRTDHIDSLLLHRPDALMEPEEIAEAFSSLRESGKVLEFGVSNQNPAMMQLLTETLPMPLVTNQVQLSLAFAPSINAMLNINRGIDEAEMRDGGMLEYARRKRMTVQAWSPLQYGNMEGSFLGNARFAALNAELNLIADKYNSTPMAVALAWVLRYPGDVQALIGTTRPERVREAAAATDLRLTRADWYNLYRAAGHTIP